jgi:hypothetical protein
MNSRLPFKLRDDWSIEDADGVLVAMMTHPAGTSNEIAKANAEFIVESCNKTDKPVFGDEQYPNVDTI